jgi:hypothetical protein
MHYSSSLERIERLNDRMLNSIGNIQGMICNPKLSGITEKSYQALLSKAFMKEAEVSRRWVAIGFDEWIQAGRWWLLKAQSTLYTDSDTKIIPPQAFADLLKASFILIDIFPQHPQRQFWNSEYSDVEILAEAVKSELESIEKLGYRRPNLGRVKTSDLKLWPDSSHTAVQPKVGSGNSPAGVIWATETDTAIWQGFGSYIGRNEPSKTQDCVILILVNHNCLQARIVAQNQKGLDLCEFEIDMDMLICSFVCVEGHYGSPGSHNPKPRPHPGIGITRHKGVVPVFSMLELIFEGHQITFTSERNLDEFTTVLTAIMLQAGFEGLAKDISTLWGLVLLLSVSRQNHTLCAKYFTICQQILEENGEDINEDSGTLGLAITTAKALSDLENLGGETEFGPPWSQAFENEFAWKKFRSWSVSALKTYFLWCWLLVAFHWPILMKTNWQKLLEPVHIQNNEDEDETDCHYRSLHPRLSLLRYGNDEIDSDHQSSHSEDTLPTQHEVEIDWNDRSPHSKYALSSIAVGYCTATTSELLSWSIGFFHSNQVLPNYALRWRYQMLKDIGHLRAITNFEEEDVILHLMDDLVFLALAADNTEAIQWLLDQDECGKGPGLLGPPYTFFLQPGFHQMHRRREDIELYRTLEDRKMSILPIALIARSLKVVRFLLHNLREHIDPSSSWKFLLTGIFFVIFEGYWRWDYDEHVGSHLAWVVLWKHETMRQNEKSKVVSTYMFNRKLVQQNLIRDYEAMIEMMVKSGSLSLDNDLVKALEFGNVLTWRILIFHGAQITPKAEEIRSEIVLDHYRECDWSAMLKEAWMNRHNWWANGGDHYDDMPCSQLISNVNWLFGGRFDISYLDQAGMRTQHGDMSFWNQGTRAEEVNRMMDRIDTELGRPFKIDFRICRP